MYAAVWWSFVQAQVVRTCGSLEAHISWSVFWEVEACSASSRYPESSRWPSSETDASL
jgi:hypothetical protein